MKLHVLHDAKGRILAAVQLDPQAEGPVPRPTARRGQKTVELEVPAEHYKLDLPALCQNLRVDVKRKALVAVAKRGGRKS